MDCRFDPEKNVNEFISELKQNGWYKTVSAHHLRILKTRYIAFGAPLKTVPRARFIRAVYGVQCQSSPLPFQIDKNNDGFIDLKELKDALNVCGFKIPGWKVRQMEEEFKSKKRTINDGKLSYEEFENLCSDLKASEIASTFVQVVSRNDNLQRLGGTSEASNEGTTHSVRLEEQLAFSDWINSNLGQDPDLRHLLPIDTEGKTLYEKVTDGILLW